MGRPNSGAPRRKSSTIHYQTFPTPPPKSKGQPPSDTSRTSSHDGPHLDSTGSKGLSHEESPLPIRQLVVLAVISLSEQTAINSIGTYLPQMVATFEDVGPGQVGLYAGLVASSFALAQFATNSFWGWLSDRIGRKPVLLTGTLLTAACFIAFGFCKTLWQATVVQILMGLGTGNQGILSTCLEEITDRRNQSRALIYLPVIYGLGGITGPVVGGLLVSKDAHFSKKDPYPYMKPNLLSAAILIIAMIITMIFLEESLEEAQDVPPLGKRVGSFFVWVWQSAGSSGPSYLRIPGVHHKRSLHIDGDAANEEEYEEDSDSDSVSQTSILEIIPRHTTDLTHSQVFNRDTMLLMSTYLIFQLSNVSYNALYPIFGQAAPARGRDLSPKEIGFSLAFASAVTIFFQLGFFVRLRERLGNRVSYRSCMAAMAVAFLMTPWVGYKDSRNGDGGMSTGKAWLWVELGFVLSVKSLAAVGCLTSFLLLITNSAPNHSILGTLNGHAQTLSAAGRAIGPFLAGGLFSLTTHVEPKGEAITFGVFGGVAFVGFLMTFGIRGANLESERWDEEEGSEEDEEDGEEYDHGSRRPCANRA